MVISDNSRSSDRDGRPQTELRTSPLRRRRFDLGGRQVGVVQTLLARVGLAADQRVHYLVIAAAVLATVILIRFAWVMSYNTVVRWRIRRVGFHPPRPMMPPTVKGGLIISWCGMRGIVTLVAALALPNGDGGPVFPFRDLIVFVAFCVVLNPAHSRPHAASIASQA